MEPLLKFYILMGIHIVHSKVGWVELIVMDDLAIERVSYYCSKSFTANHYTSEQTDAKIPLKFEIDTESQVFPHRYFAALRVYAATTEEMGLLWAEMSEDTTALSLSNELRVLDIASIRFEEIASWNEEGQRLYFLQLRSAAVAARKIIESIQKTAGLEKISKQYLMSLIPTNSNEKNYHQANQILEDYIVSTMLPMLNKYLNFKSRADLSHNLIARQEALPAANSGELFVSDKDLNFYYNNTNSTSEHVVLRSLRLYVK